MTPKSPSDQKAPSQAKRAKRPKCPHCGKQAVRAYRPFCTKACADVDLDRWLAGRYVVAGEQAGKKSDDEVED